MKRTNINIPHFRLHRHLLAPHYLQADSEYYNVFARYLQEVPDLRDCIMLLLLPGYQRTRLHR